MQVFNSRMCQLVLGAGAMQVSGLRSITAKHLALSSQCLSAYMALHPFLKSLLTAGLPTPRLGLLLPEFDRLLQVSCIAVPALLLFDASTLAAKLCHIHLSALLLLLYCCTVLLPCCCLADLLPCGC